MTNKRSNRETAFTMTELLMIIVILALALAITSSGMKSAKEKARREQCYRNLREIGLAFRQWPSGSSDWYPMRVPDDQGGAQQSIIHGEVFRAFQALSNELSSPKLFVCPSDKRTPAPNYVVLLSNTNVTYFVGIDAEESFPQTFLSGDRNLEIDGVAAKPGIVTLQTNNVIGWTRNIHKRQGNVGFADGTVQGFKNQHLCEALAQTGVATNRLAIP